MELQNIYTSVSCNRKPCCLDWGNNGYIIYGATCSICLVEIKPNHLPKITKTFIGHEKSINCVKWISSDDKKETEFLSGGSDGFVLIWNISETNPSTVCKLPESVQNLNVLRKNDTIYVAVISENIIQLLSGNGKNFTSFQEINLERSCAFAISFYILPQCNQIILAETREDNNINIWIEKKSQESISFVFLTQLEGHVDWVKGLDFIKMTNDESLLTSCSQDTFIRLWKITEEQIDDQVSSEISFLNNLIVINDQNIKFKISFEVESVLQSHDNWVNSVQCKEIDNSIKILSASLDKTIIIWEFDPQLGVWMEKIRLGEVGGNQLGFLGAKFSNDGNSILGQGFQGALHLYKKSNKNNDLWEPQTSVGGHFNCVRDICWEPQGEFLLSVSADETTRIHAPFRVNSNAIETWHELCRPQVHGYGLQTIAAINRYKFVSGGEEKLLRVFEATNSFLQSFKNICKIKTDETEEVFLKSLPMMATVPSLGLSNKAIYAKEEAPPEITNQIKNSEANLIENTIQEETLIQNTLWPEVQKLYGHGNEIFALDCSPNSLFLASSCKATSIETAEIIIWSVPKYKIIQKLRSHNLTVTQLKFSPDNKYLLSVSRDRTWTLFKNTSANEANFELIQKSDKNSGVHTRIIWSCAWSHDTELFATSSRDGKIVVWKENTEEKDTWKSLNVFKEENESFKSVCFGHKYFENPKQYLIATGYESGIIKILKFDTAFEILIIIDRNYAHHLSVNKLEFKPNCDDFILASCSDDSFVRINKLQLRKS